jgi:hypothetical protein
MSFNSKTINFKAGFDTSQVATGTQKIQGYFSALNTKVSSISRSFSSLGGIMAGAFSAQLVGVSIKGAIDKATDLNETISKTKEVFGSAANEIYQFSKTTAKSLGVSQKNSLDTASSFAIFGRAAGLSGDQLSNFAINLTKLSSDLASFYNTSPEDAAIAISAALRGEAEPIRRYGVLMDDATLRQIAFKNGITDTIKQALTPQQKVLAANLLIVEQTTVAQGDFARTAEGAANQARILTAQIDELSTSIGKKLEPAHLAFLKFFNKWIDKISAGWAILGDYLHNTWKVAINAIDIAWSGFVIGILQGFKKINDAGKDFFAIFGVDVGGGVSKFLDDTIKSYEDRIKDASKRQYRTMSDIRGAFFANQGGDTISSTDSPIKPIKPKPLPLTDSEKEAIRKALAEKNAFTIEQYKAFNGSLLHALKKEENPIIGGFVESLTNPAAIGKLKEGFVVITKEFENMAEAINNAIDMYVKSALIDVFTRLGEGLFGAAKDVENWGNQMIASFGGFLQQMGAMIMTYGWAMDAFKKAFAKPAVAFAAGAALIVLGAGIKKMHENKMGGASLNGGGGGVPSSSFNQGYNFESRLDGYDLVLVSDRNQRLRTRRG